MCKKKEVKRINQNNQTNPRYPGYRAFFSFSLSQPLPFIQGGQNNGENASSFA